MIEKPAPGTVVAFSSFDPERRSWEQVTVSYEGRGKLGDGLREAQVARLDQSLGYLLGRADHERGVVLDM